MKETVSNPETIKECPFCDILEGRESGLIIKCNPNTSLILALEGHPLLITNRHLGLTEIPEDVASEIGREITGSLAKIKDFYKAEGINILTSLGQAAGQEIEHTHIHFIPRFSGDGVGKFPRNLLRKPINERQRIASGLMDVLVEG